MAVSKIPTSASFSIEVQKGVDSKGNAVYTKKSFSGVKENASPENILAVADAIKNVLSADTGNVYLTVTDSLLNL